MANSNFEYLLQKLINGETITDYEPQSRLEEHLIACINKMGKDGLGDPRSSAEVLLQMLAENLTNDEINGEPIHVTELPNNPEINFTYNLNGELYQAIPKFISSEDVWDYSYTTVKFNKETMVKELEAFDPDENMYYFNFWNDNEDYYVYIEGLEKNKLTYKKSKSNYDTGEEEIIDEYTIYENGVWYVDEINFDEPLWLDDCCIDHYDEEEHIVILTYDKQISGNYFEKYKSDVEYYKQNLPLVSKYIYKKIEKDMDSGYFGIFDIDSGRINLEYLYEDVDVRKIYEYEKDFGYVKLPYFEYQELGLYELDLRYTFAGARISNEILNHIFDEFNGWLDEDGNPYIEIVNLDETFIGSDLDEFDMPGIKVKPYTMNSAFYKCSNLTKVKGIDLGNINNTNNLFGVFYNCYYLSELELFNIRQNLTIGYRSSYGHRLTVESLIQIISELIKDTRSHTLSMGSTNLAKLENVYVRLIEDADEDKNKIKLPFEVCNADDEGAMSIIVYANSKNWTLA